MEKSARSFPPLVAASAFLAFLPALGAGYVSWDDPLHILRNPLLADLSPRGVWAMFTRVHATHYAPLAWLSLAVERALGGGAPFPHHLTNVLLHALNAGLVVGLAERVFALAGVPAKHRAAAALFAALAWALHPLRAEPVAWITQRREVLGGLFLLLSLRFYLDRKTLPSLLAFAAAVLSRNTAVAALGFFFVLDAWPLRRLRRSEARFEKVPFVLIALAGAALAVHSNLGVTLHGETLRARFAGKLVAAAYTLAAYPLGTLWPFGLGPVYPAPAAPSLFEPRFGLSVLAVLAAAWVLVRNAERHPAPAAAFAAYALAVSPALAVIDLDFLAGDRFSYIATLPLFLLAAGAGAGRKNLRLPALLVLTAWSLLSIRQSSYWSDTGTLMTRAVSTYPENFRARMVLGLWHAEREEWTRAEPQFRAAAAARKNFHHAIFLLGYSLERQGRRREAAQRYREALRLDPEYEDALEGLRRVGG